MDREQSIGDPDTTYLTVIIVVPLQADTKQRNNLPHCTYYLPTPPSTHSLPNSISLIPNKTSGSFSDDPIISLGCGRNPKKEEESWEH